MHITAFNHADSHPTPHAAIATSLPPFSTAFSSKKKGNIRLGILVCSLLLCFFLSSCNEAEIKGTLQAPAHTVQEIATGLRVPWDTTFAPDGTLYFTERHGVLSARKTNGEIAALAKIPDVYILFESGLMGIETDPDFAQNRKIYLCYSHVDGNIHVAIWKIDAENKSATPVEDPLVTIESSDAPNHKGCRLRITPDGNLWISTGDSNLGNVPQDLTSLAGKILRVNRHTGEGTPDNPFADSPNPNTRRIYTYGHRNPQGLAWRFTPDKKEGESSLQMFSVEHGPSRDDEINLLRPGMNAGWDPGPHDYNWEASMTNTRKYPDAVQPVWKSGFPTLAPSGAVFLEGSQWGKAEGLLAVASLKTQQILLFRLDDDGALLRIGSFLKNKHGRLRSLTLGPDGNLYVTTSNTSKNSKNVDVIFRIVPEPRASTERAS